MSRFADLEVICGRGGSFYTGPAADSLAWGAVPGPGVGRSYPASVHNPHTRDVYIRHPCPRRRGAFRCGGSSPTAPGVGV